jgi:hypothetical protein
MEERKEERKEDEEKERGRAIRKTAPGVLSSREKPTSKLNPREPNPREKWEKVGRVDV